MIERLSRRGVKLRASDATRVRLSVAAAGGVITPAKPTPGRDARRLERTLEQRRCVSVSSLIAIDETTEGEAE